MDSGVPELPTEEPVAPTPPRPALATLFARLVDQTEIFVRAEVQLYRAQATRKALSAGVVAGLVGGALVLAQAVVVALLIGILFALASAVGMVWATAIVTIGGLAIAGLLFGLAAARISRLIKPNEKS